MNYTGRVMKASR